MIWLASYLLIGFIAFGILAAWRFSSLMRENRYRDLAILCLAFLALWPLLFPMLIKDAIDSRREAARTIEREKPFAVTQDDLEAETTIERIEADERVHDPLNAAPDLAFGHLHQCWANFKSKLQAEDRIWSFRSVRPTSWGKDREIRTGYVVRRGDALEPFILAQFYWSYERDADSSTSGGQGE